MRQGKEAKIKIKTQVNKNNRLCFASLIMSDKDYYKKIRKGLLIEPKTAFEKNYFYAYNFKKEAKGLDKYQILARLKILSNLIIKDNKQSYLKRRSKKHRSKKICFACKKESAHCQHHIILLKNGGYDNGINRLPICDNCHSLIHDWL